MPDNQELSSTIVESVNSIVDEHDARLIETFKDLHRNPELGFLEERTSGILAEALRALGYDVTTGVGKTGVVGILHNGDGPTVMYRADMDANGVEEATGLDYASTVVQTLPDGSQSPAAHMCGHDAHVTWLIGMATVLVELRDRWSGTAILIGQPAEEPIMGAKAMVTDGLYDIIPVPDAFIGIHTAPIPVGRVISAGGTRMAGTDQIDILFRGLGGHGSMPHLTQDPVVMSTLAVTEFQSIVSRRIDPAQTAVLTVGAIHAGTDNNVIPSEAIVKANLRWYEPQIREQLIAGIRSVSESIARGYGVPEDRLPTLTFKGGSTPLINTPELAERLAATLGGVIGADNVVTEVPAALGSEDVHLLRGPHEDIDFTFLIVGVADPEVCQSARESGKLYPYSPHNPNYIVELDSIAFGAKVASYAMLSLLGATA